MTASPGLALVSGAGGGIGQAIALGLCEAGYRLALLGRDRAALDRTLTRVGAAARGWSCDLADAEAVERAVAQIVAELGCPNVVVAAAGTASVARLEQTSPQRFAEIVASNLAGPFHLVRALLPALRQLPAGAHLFPILSLAATRGLAGWSAYSASKWGLRGLVAALREELRGSALRLTEIYPGATATELWAELPGDWDAARMMPAEDVASAVLWALSRSPRTVVEQIHLGPLEGPL